jgi:hypothetical protein
MISKLLNLAAMVYRQLLRRLPRFLEPPFAREGFPNGRPVGPPELRRIVAVPKVGVFITDTNEELPDPVAPGRGLRRRTPPTRDRLQQRRATQAGSAMPEAGRAMSNSAEVSLTAGIPDRHLADDCSFDSVQGSAPDRAARLRRSDVLSPSRPLHSRVGSVAATVYTVSAMPIGPGQGTPLQPFAAQLSYFTLRDRRHYDYLHKPGIPVLHQQMILDPWGYRPRTTSIPVSTRLS